MSVWCALIENTESRDRTRYILHGVRIMNLQPPTPFLFANSEEWPKWKRRFEQYRQASGLAEKGEERQVSTLLYFLGEDAEEVLDTTRISTDDRKKYQKVIEEFDSYFKVKKNVIYERARFNQRSQLPGEPADRFITEIHRLAENCEFGGMKDELIRERLVVGIRDSTLSEHLQLEPELTLDKAKKLIRQRESVRTQQDILQRPFIKQESSSLDAVKQFPPTSDKPTFNKCRRCGTGAHPRQSCPAKEATCFRCNRRGHFSSQCLSNTIAMISVTTEQPLNEQVQQYEDLKYLDTVENTNGNMWELQVRIGQNSIKFKVDTGAEVTVLSEATWNSLN